MTTMSEDSIIIRVPFVPKFEQYCRSIRLDDLTDVYEEALHFYYEAASRLIPKILLRPMTIDSYEVIEGTPVVFINGIRFSGKAFELLKNIQRIVVYVETCGHEMEDFDLHRFDMLSFYWLDIVKAQSLEMAHYALMQWCAENMGFINPASLNPGSGNTTMWPIEQLHGLFTLLGGTDQIGVSLTESSMMIPNKSLAGLVFKSRTVDFDSCSFCDRVNCADRRVPLNLPW